MSAWLRLGVRFGLGCLAALLVGVILLRVIPARQRIAMTVAPAAQAQGMTILLRSPDSMMAEAPRPTTSPAENSLSDYDRFLFLLNANILTETLAQDSSLMQSLFKDQWNPQTGTWHPPKGLKYRMRSAFLRLAGRNAWHPPNARSLAVFLQRQIQLEQIGSTRLYRVSLLSTDSETAITLLEKLAFAADKALATQAQDRLLTQLQQVNAALLRETIPQRRASLANLAEQIHAAQLFIVPNLPFAGEVIEKPAPLTSGALPNPWLILAGCFCLVQGLIFRQFLLGDSEKQVYRNA